MYADSKNCALLKEAVSIYCGERTDMILLARYYLTMYRGSMMIDLLTAVNRGKKKDDDKSAEACGVV